MTREYAEAQATYQISDDIKDTVQEYEIIRCCLTEVFATVVLLSICTGTKTL